MAGDWIKMRRALLTDPRVVRIMSALHADRFRTIGGLFSAWCLIDEQTEDGSLAGYTPEILDEFVGMPGLCDAMISVGWIQETSQGLEAVNFAEHNGQTAKRRAQDNVRKMSAREADKKRTPCGQKADQRREENIGEPIDVARSATDVKRFKKPTVLELEHYALSLSRADFDAEAFYDHYESNGWKVGGRSAMKDWQAAVRNWLKRDRSTINGNHSNRNRELTAEDVFSAEALGRGGEHS
jgi:hypothetical protein